MSRSRKRTPVSTWCYCKSQKRGKQRSSRRFRRRESMLMQTQNVDNLPLRPRDITSPWTLGGDGKRYWNLSPNDDRLKRLLRK